METSQDEITTVECNFSELRNFLVGEEIPVIKGFITPKLLSIETKNGKIYKEYSKKLPISPIGVAYLGFSKIKVMYVITISEDRIQIETGNPPSLDKYFHYYERVTFKNLEGFVEITRESCCKNLVCRTTIGSHFAGDPEEEFHSTSKAYIQYAINRANE